MATVKIPSAIPAEGMESKRGTLLNVAVVLGSLLIVRKVMSASIDLH
jgi:hypothetical protein